MSEYRIDIADIISSQIEIALKKEYDRGWSDCMKYYWSKREEEYKSEQVIGVNGSMSDSKSEGTGSNPV